MAILKNGPCYNKGLDHIGVVKTMYCAVIPHITLVALLWLLVVQKYDISTDL